MKQYQQIAKYTFRHQVKTLANTDHAVTATSKETPCIHNSIVTILAKINVMNDFNIIKYILR